MIPMKKYFLSLIIAIAIFSCKNTPEGMTEGKGGRLYGGYFTTNETENYQTLYPYSITDVVSSHVAAQVYEGLVKFDTKDLSIIPSLAEKWEMDESGKVYTFHIKKEVFFHDNECFPEGKGREVKASDFEYSFKKLCTASPDNFNFSNTFKDKVLGANEFYDATQDGKNPDNIPGIKVIDDYTIQITLTEPSSTFLYALANPGAYVVPKEAVEQYGTMIRTGTGPFLFNSQSDNSNRVVLVKNQNYHGVDTLGNKLPFLDSVIINFLPTKAEELNQFKEGKIDMIVGLPSESIKEMVETNVTDFEGKNPKYILDRGPEMITQYYEFNLTKQPFDDVKVRQAFNYAIDRKKIIDAVLKGEAYGPAENGICPPSFKGYDISKITGYNFDPEKAKKLLAEAGFKDGKGFPTVKVELNSGGSKHTNVVVEIQKQLNEVLGVYLDFDVVSQGQKLDDAKYARSDIFRSAWVADFPNPENFLWTLYGGTVPASLEAPSFPNSPRYKNAAYDSLYEAGKRAKSIEESYENFMKAEQIMVNDAPIMTLWYDETYRLLQSRVKNYYSNPMRYRDYSQVYIIPQAKEEKAK